MNILVVDDDLTTRNFLKVLINNLDPKISVSLAPDGKQALELASNQKYDLILLDVEMPGMPGDEVGKALKKSATTAETPIIFISAYEQGDIIKSSGFKSGSVDFVKKPIDSTEIANKVELYKAQKNLQDINRYTEEQQESARHKQLNIIVNDLENDNEFNVGIIYEPSDILSGDSYSIFKKEDGSIIIYMVDGQGHGILPSLTVFATSSAFKQAIAFTRNLKNLSQRVLESMVGVLDSGEQLAFTAIYISPDRKKIEYSIGGMYPFFVKDNGIIKEMVTNNLPMMNFTDKLNITTLELESFEGLVLFSDGLVEEYESQLTGFKPQDLLQESAVLKTVQKLVKKIHHKDDVSLVLMEKAST